MPGTARSIKLLELTPPCVISRTIVVVLAGASKTLPIERNAPMRDFLGFKTVAEP